MIRRDFLMVGIQLSGEQDAIGEIHLTNEGVSSYSCQKGKGTKLEEIKMNWSK